MVQEIFINSQYSVKQGKYVWNNFSVYQFFSFYWPQIFAKGPVSESQPKTFDKRPYGKSEESKSSNIATFLPKSITSYHQEKISHNRHAEKILKT